MGEATDFQTIRKKRQRKLALKRLLVLAAAALLVVGIFLLNDLMIRMEVFNRLGDSIASLGGAGFPTALPGGTILDTEPMKDDLAVLNETNLYIFSKKGKEIQNIQHAYNNPQMRTSQDKVLIYDGGGKNLKVYSRSKELFSKSFNHTISYADISDSGYMAVNTGARQSLCMVTVFDMDYQEIFRWNSSEKMVVHVALPPKGDMIAVSSVSAQGGRLRSTIHLFKLNMTTEAARFDFEGELVLSLDFENEHTIRVLTDQKVRQLTTEGKIKENTYDLGGRKLCSFREGGGGTALLLENYQSSQEREIVLLDGNLNQTGKITGDQTIKGMALAGQNCYVIMDTILCVYDLAGQEQARGPISDIQSVHGAGKKLYYFTKDEIFLYSSNVSGISESSGKGK